MKKPFLFTVVFILLMRIAVMSVTSVFDTSESRYAAISQNMATSGDFVVPRYYHSGVYQNFDGKPPLYFQSAALCRKALPAEWREFAVRLPALMSAIALLWLLWLTVRKFSDSESARYAVLFCMTYVVFFMMAGVCMTDMMLTFSICGALLCQALFAKTLQNRYSLAVFALLGIGMMVKGPVAPALFGLTVLTDAILNKRMGSIRRHSWFWGFIVFLSIALPWYVMMARRDPNFLYYFFINENFLRFLVHNYGDRYGCGHESFRGMAALLFVVSTLPWMPFIIPAIRTKHTLCCASP